MTSDELMDDIDEWRQTFNDAYTFASLAVEGDPERGGIAGLTAMMEAQQLAVNRLYIIVKGQQKMIEVLTQSHDALAQLVGGDYD